MRKYVRVTSRPTKLIVVLLGTFVFVAFIGTAVVSIARGPGTTVFGLQIAAKKTPTPKPTPTPKATPPGKKKIVISGNALNTLSPDESSPIALTFSNPNNQPVEIASVTVTVQPDATKNGSPVSGCNGPDNVEIVKNFTGPTVTVPKNGTASVPDPAVNGPIVKMKNTEFLQDACKGATFHFTSSAQAATK